MNLFSKTIVGLDIGTSSVKLVELKKTNDRWKLMAMGIMDIPRESLDAKNPDQQRLVVADTIKRTYEKSGIKIKKVTTALLGESIIIRYVKMSFMTEEELRKTISKEAEQHIPLSMDQVVLDFQVLGESQEDGQRSQRRLSLS